VPKHYGLSGVCVGFRIRSVFVIHSVMSVYMLLCAKELNTLWDRLGMRKEKATTTSQTKLDLLEQSI
jgi:hypothetical protein